MASELKALNIPLNARFFRKGNKFDSFPINFISGLQKKYEIKEEHILKDDTFGSESSIKYNFILFSCPEVIPPFMNVKKDGSDTIVLSERKVGYFMIVEYKDYVAIFQRNAPSFEKYIGVNLLQLEPDDFLRVRIDKDSKFKKFALSNIDGSDDAIRSKTYISQNLNVSFPTLGASRYTIDSLRAGKSHGASFSMNAIDARLTDICENNEGLEGACKWAKKVIDVYISINKAGTGKETLYTDIFARTLPYPKHKDKLVPNYILFDFWEILEACDMNDIVIKKSGKEIEISVFREYISKNFDNIIKIEKDTSGSEKWTASYKSLSKRVAKITIYKRHLGIRVDCAEWRAIKIKRSNGMEFSLSDHANNYFSLYFKNYEYVYHNGKLVEDHQMKTNLENFYMVFTPYSELENTKTEKGIPSGNDKTLQEQALNDIEKNGKFPEDSIFGFVEEKFKNGFDYFILEDMGYEYADHIGISEDKISFFVEKHKKKTYSATAFQDVVGQALKNLGNICKPEHDRKNKWKNKWQDKLPRSRKSNNIEDALKCWQKAVKNPTTTRELILVVDFIKLKELKDELNKFANGELTGDKNTKCSQILFLLSSFINSARDLNIVPRIYCRD